MTPRVSPIEPNPNCHFSLMDRTETVLGLTVCDERGTPRPFTDERLYVKIPVETTAQKQTSGSSSYADFDYPYSPIVQDDISGGRGGKDYERDSTKVYDLYRCRSGRQNVAYAGPLEQYATGVRGLTQNMPGSVTWVRFHEYPDLIGFIAKRFQATESFTAGKLWLLLRRKGNPNNLTVKLYADSGGSMGTLLDTLAIDDANLDDLLSEWVTVTISRALTSGTYYWIELSNIGGNGFWYIGCKPVAGTTYKKQSSYSSYGLASYDLYFRMTDANTSKNCIMFEYKEQQYFVISPASGAPSVYMAGDRGAADSNSGQLTKLIDATKSWTVNEHAGVPVLITDGTGKLEVQKWRTVVSNTATELVVDSAWTITQDPTTEYVLFGTKIKSLGACGLTAPVTDVLVSTSGVVYMCMGDSVAIRALRSYNNSGTWVDFDNAANCQRDETDAKSKAVFMVYRPQSQTIVIANNSDGSGDVSINTNTNTAPTVPVWGTSLTWGATPVKVDSKYRRINGLIVHPDGSGNEAVWVFKTDVPFIVPSTGNPYPVSIEEMRNVRNDSNGVRPMRHGVYLYFPLLQGIQRYYGGQFDSVGPNLGDGLPTNRRGVVVGMLGYPGVYFSLIDAGDSGYSAVMESSWHERYRAPKGQRIKAAAFQVTPGSTIDRMWVYQGNDLIWLPFPSETNELDDASYQYAPEFCVTLARMHAGMFDVQKIVKKIKLQTERLTASQWFEIDYRVDGTESWSTLNEPIDPIDGNPQKFTTSPLQAMDFSDVFGIAGKRIQFRLRGYTSDASKTSVFVAIILSAVVRVDIKSMYGPFTLLVKDDERVALRENEKTYTADEKLTMLENWGDASNDSMLLMRSMSGLCDNKMIFINVGTRRQIAFAGAENNPYKGNAYVVSVTMQEA